ncbi:MAG: glutamate racemase [Clostridia bacterium]|nr:glutamate racemase [Clostridia bacterium]
MIGVFDSGVGGLSALRTIRAAAPQADLFYFADEANLPYGEKTEDELLSLSRAAVSRLLSAGADAILCACGTVSSTALPTLVRECPVPLYGILDPLAEATACASAEKGGAILVLGTRATVERGALEAKIRDFATHAPLLTHPCPDFVMLAEEKTALSEGEILRRVSATLAPFLGKKIGAIALGCTHFSCLAREIGSLFPRAAIVDGANEGARAALASLPAAALVGTGQTTLTTSGDRALRFDM